MARRTIDDTRRFRRRTVRILVDYVSENGVCCDYATTLGAGGLFIECEEPLPKGTAVKLRFRLPGGDDCHEIEGRVCWSRGGSSDAPLKHAPGMGIQFTDSVSSSRLARDLEDVP